MKVFGETPPAQTTFSCEENTPPAGYLNNRRARLLENSYYYSVLNQASIEALSATADISNDGCRDYKALSAHEAIFFATGNLDEQHTKHSETDLALLPKVVHTKNTASLIRHKSTGVSKVVEHISYAWNACRGRADSTSLQAIENVNYEQKNLNSSVKNQSSTASRLINFTPGAPELLLGAPSEQASRTSSEAMKLDPASSTSGNTHHQVEKYGGEVRFTFSQNESAFDEEINKSANTADGVCLSLTMNWIVAHSKEQNLLTYIYSEGNRNHVKPEAMKVFSLPYEERSTYKQAADYYRVPLKEQQISMIPPTSSQDFLDKNKLVRIKQNMTGKSPSGLASYGFTHLEQMEPIPEYHPASLLAAILDNPRQEGGIYKSVFMTGPNLGHIIAVHLCKTGEVSFFEPNSGEFRFPDSSYFADWFLQAYMAENTLKSEFHVMAYVYSPSPELSDCSAFAYC